MFLLLMEQISYTDFEKVELRVWTILEAHEFPEARKPAYKLIVDFGPEIGIKKSSAQITTHYKADELIGKQIVGVVNFPPKQIWPWVSECLVTWFADGNSDVVLVSPDMKIENGMKLF